MHSASEKRQVSIAQLSPTMNMLGNYPKSRRRTAMHCTAGLKTRTSSLGMRP